MKQIAILGSTGSIGKSALKVVRNLSGKVKVVALSANTNAALLQKQIKEFCPEFAVLGDCNKLLELVKEKKIDQVLFAISGVGALEPLLAAIDAKKEIALANKEAMVAAGSIIMQRAAAKNVKIIPIDSEESAIWQCLEGQDKTKIKTIHLTASGGPLRKASPKELKNISVEKVLDHPRWKMGKKITVDSATLMNKGLEFLETMHLFGVPAEKIKILVHPEALIHSMVEFVDGSILAQLSVTDMCVPIQYALTYPERQEADFGRISFAKVGKLNFEEPDLKKFPCLGLALLAAKELGTVPAVLNAANEVAVAEFLERRLKFNNISEVISRVIGAHHKKSQASLEDIREADSWARIEAHKIIQRLN